MKKKLQHLPLLLFLTALLVYSCSKDFDDDVLPSISAEQKVEADPAIWDYNGRRPIVRRISKEIVRHKDFKEVKKWLSTGKPLWDSSQSLILNGKPTMLVPVANGNRDGITAIIGFTYEGKGKGRKLNYYTVSRKDLKNKKAVPVLSPESWLGYIRAREKMIFNTNNGSPGMSKRKTKKEKQTASGLNVTTSSMAWNCTTYEVEYCYVTETCQGEDCYVTHEECYTWYEEECWYEDDPWEDPNYPDDNCYDPCYCYNDCGDPEPQPQPNNPCNEIPAIENKAIDPIIASQNQQILNLSNQKEWGAEQNLNSLSGSGYMNIPVRSDASSNTFKTNFSWNGTEGYTIGVSHGHPGSSAPSPADAVWAIGSLDDYELQAAGQQNIFKNQFSLTVVSTNGTFVITVKDWDALRAHYTSYNNNSTVFNQTYMNYGGAYATNNPGTDNTTATTYAFLKIFGNALNLYSAMPNSNNFNPVKIDLNGNVAHVPCL